MLKGYRCERDRALVHVMTTDGSVGYDDGIIEENVRFFSFFLTKYIKRFKKTV